MCVCVCVERAPFMGRCAGTQVRAGPGLPPPLSVDFSLSLSQSCAPDPRDGWIASEFGSAGHRSLYLSHAKRPLYHLSYTPGKTLGALANHTSLIHTRKE